MRLPGESPAGAEGDGWTVAGVEAASAKAGGAGVGAARSAWASALGVAMQKQATNEIVAPASATSRRRVIRAGDISSGR
jgi:hypothetical protein